MILTCPECATRYFIDDGLIGFSGRVVKCSSCGKSWHAYPEEEPLDLGPSAAPAPEDDLFADEAEAEAEGGSAPLSALPADKLPGAFRAKAEERRRVREAATQGAVWAGIAAAFALVLAAMAVFRVDVVRAWPKSASAYAAVGLPVNTIGLAIEGVEAQPGLQDGRAAVVVTGALRNIEDRPVVAPPLRINLLSKAGKTVQGKIAAPADPKIPPGEKRHFTVTLLDPPTTATDVEVVFDLAARPHTSPKAHAKAPAANLRPAAPAPPPKITEARPIEGSSPYALPEPVDGE